jgi:hypothetical protein
VVAASKLTRKPSELGWGSGRGDPDPGRQRPIQAVTSLGVGAGDTFLLHGGSGAVGQAAIPVRAAIGATVVATASEPNHDRLRELGAIPVAYGPGLVDRVRCGRAAGASTWPSTPRAPTRRSRSRRSSSPTTGAWPPSCSAPARAELGIRAWGGGNPVP